MARARTEDRAQGLEAEKLRLELVTLRLEHRAQRAAIVWKWLGALGASLLLVAIVALLVSAATSRGIVIERFEAVPGVVAGEASEEMLAESVLHRLAWMRANTHTNIWSRAHVGAPTASWLDDIRVEIPQTGIAVGDLHRALRRGLGRDTYLRGRLIPGDANCAFRALAWEAGSARDPICGRPGTDPLVAAAEAMYRQAHPYLYAVYLSSFDTRLTEANGLLRELAYSSRDRTERVLALNALAANLLEFEGRCEAALSLLEAAAELRGNFANVWANISNAHHCTGDDHEAAEATEREIAVLRSFNHELSPRKAQQRLREARSLLVGYRGDFAERLRLAREMAQLGFGEQADMQAESLADLHDLGGAHRYLTPASSADLSRTRRAWLAFKILWEQERWREAAEQLERLNEYYREWGPYTGRQTLTQNEPLLAVAWARAGRTEKAVEITRRLPSRCYLCARGRALVAEAIGRRAEAERWFAEAIRLAPDFPTAYGERGQALLARGQTAAARDSLTEAVRRGPRWADALKWRGEALIALGDLEGALRDYEAAIAIAPRWSSLRISFGLALWRAGRRDEARAQFRSAARLPGRAVDERLLRRIFERIGR